MNRSFGRLVTLSLVVVAMSWSADALAQSTADGKRTLKAMKMFYITPGMIEVVPRCMRDTLMMTGYVPSEDKIKEADGIAGKIKGVKDIRNRIRVRAPEVSSGGDDVITQKIDTAIAEDEDLAKAKAKGQLEIAVSEGAVTIGGKVPDWTVAQTLINDVKRIPGVKTLDFDKLKYCVPSSGFRLTRLDPARSGPNVADCRD